MTELQLELALIAVAVVSYIAGFSIISVMVFLAIKRKTITWGDRVLYRPGGKRE